jgi:hypothetical protein
MGPTPANRGGCVGFSSPSHPAQTQNQAKQPGIRSIRLEAGDIGFVPCCWPGLQAGARTELSVQVDVKGGRV